MQNPQQVGGGGPQSVSGYGGGVAAEMVISDENQKLGDLGIAEAASPISSRPPAQAGIGNANFEEMIQATAEAGGSSGNRWPRQETLALLQIRSEMDAAFRDATLKGPLWEQVSRKLGELGYKRSAKKCKEKFENVHKYYKRTKEGRGGRQDGKSYKFFTQLEALNHSIATAAQLLPRIANPTAAAPPPLPQPAAAAVVSLPPPAVAVAGTSTREGSAVPLFGVSFSSDSSSSEDDDEEEDEEMELGDDRNQRKRKRSHGGEDQSEERMMDFFECLLKQVMQKQEAMQQKFLEAIEKREQDRMIREEAWKRQDMARVAHEHDLMAQERAISASRDAAIVAFLEKITGQTIHLPTAVPQNPPPPTAATTPPPPPPPPSEHYRPQPTHDQPQSMEIVAVVPEQQIIQHDLAAGGSVGGSGGSFEMSSSRWPKAEVLALIHLRSGMEAKYLEAGPKGPLWEEISAGMQRMGYSRSAKRCKEKWENINKYFKKVKESNKKRPEDAKTCPYFHELDALYRKKIIGSTSSGGGAGGGERKLQHQQDVVTQSSVSIEKLDGGRSEAQTSGVGAMSLAASFGSQTQGNVGGENQPEDMLKKQVEENHGHMIEKCSNSINDCSNSDDEDMNYEEDEEYDEEEMKMVYKVQQFQTRPNNGGGTPPSSFVAMVQ